MVSLSDGGTGSGWRTRGEAGACLGDVPEADVEDDVVEMEKDCDTLREKLWRLVWSCCCSGWVWRDVRSCNCWRRRERSPVDARLCASPLLSEGSGNPFPEASDGLERRGGPGKASRNADGRVRSRTISGPPEGKLWRRRNLESPASAPPAGRDDCPAKSR